MQQGIEKGKIKEKQDIALRMLLLGMPVDMIMQVTGLTATEVDELQQMGH